MKIEQWRKIDGYEAYEVSDMGRVRRDGRIKKPRPDRKGYLSVALWLRQKPKKFQISRLVAAAFLGPLPTGCVVCHNNGDNTCNKIENLRYATPAQNEADKIKHGTNLLGEKHPRAKLLAHQVNEIRRRFKRGCSINGGKALAKEFGVDNTLITRIIQRKIWKDLM